MKRTAYQFSLVSYQSAKMSLQNGSQTLTSSWKGRWARNMNLRSQRKIAALRGSKCRMRRKRLRNLLTWSRSVRRCREIGRKDLITSAFNKWTSSKRRRKRHRCSTKKLIQCAWATTSLTTSPFSPWSLRKFRSTSWSKREWGGLSSTCSPWEWKIWLCKCL